MLRAGRAGFIQPRPDSNPQNLISKQDIRMCWENTKPQLKERPSHFTAVEG